ncbi:hypothetical protein [Scleromatobacter humisilvae]|uniref:Uncharacterized protein n=1 Tax=Scleromatobacter humisilvae TaxID=2897159 RepID=A0A9X1YK13_9BURK|nr:hypothetical protein [Scleromatobacter humisilvae]MCK9687341.1 hypothetical protein [Scleromatobacter humisilvae]
MSHVPTTSTAVEKLKRLAKTRRKSSGHTLAVELDAVAVDAGYTSWKHVTVCQSVTQVLSPPRRFLPPILDDYLKAALPKPADVADARRLFEHGLIIAMDVKDADGAALAGSQFEECEVVWPLASRDIWASLVFDVEDEPDKPLVDLLDDDELLEHARDDLANYRFFRYLGQQVPDSPNEILRLTREKFFFPPRFAWVDGHQVGDGELLIAQLTTPAVPWAQLDLPLATLPKRFVKAGDETHAAVTEMMRWAKQLEYIGSKAPVEERRELLSLIGGTCPYVFTRPEGGRHYHLCHPGYAPVRGVALTYEELVASGIVAWHHAHGNHDGQKHFSVVCQNVTEATDSTVLRQAARMLANLAVFVDDWREQKALQAT